MDVSSILANSNLKNYIKGNLDDLWFDTPLQGYRYMDNKQKGAYGEIFADMICKSYKLKITGRDGGCADHDMVVNNIKTEVKFSVAQTATKNKNKPNEYKHLVKDRFMVNHVGVGKGWERLLIIGINPNFEESRIVWFYKKDIAKLIKQGYYFNHQQGGKHSDNDDFMIGGNKLIELCESKYAHSLSEW